LRGFLIHFKTNRTFQKNIKIFNNMKTIKILQVLIGICVLMLYSCLDFVRHPFWIQLTRDDLTYLIYDKDSVTLYYNSEFKYKDSVYYLLDDKDTIKMRVNTIINTPSNTLGFLDTAHGNTTFGLDENSDPWFAEYAMIVDVHRTDDSTKLDKRFSVYSTHSFSPYSFVSSENDTIIPPDTAKILGKIYSDVYKLPNDKYTNFKKVYFAKKYGYIYLEFRDGKNLKLINYRHHMN